MFKKLQKDSSAFTIIEVMIVMAIAGLIIVAVLIAVPQLQRNQRNSARQSVLARIKTEIDNFSGNNNGSIPVADVSSQAANFGTPRTAAGLFARYMGCTATASAAPVCTVNINDPKTGYAVGSGATGLLTEVSTTADPTSPGALSYRTGVVCSGETTTATGASARQYALQIGLEGGAIYCLDNK